MKVVAIIQARMSSVRLPNKVLLPLAGKPVLEHIVTRLKECKTLSEVIIATSTSKDDDAISAWCEANRIYCFRGSLEDVLDRYYKAATEVKASAIVRITADCPVIDPKLVDEIVTNFQAGDFDSFALAGDFPDGLDCQVFSYIALKKAWKEATLASDREHVGTYIEKTHPELFKLGGLEKFKGLSHYRWTLDEPSDYLFLQSVFDTLYSENEIFYTEDILALMEQEPHLMQINSGIIRNEGYLKAINSENSNHV